MSCLMLQPPGGMQLAASVLLVLYLASALALLPRELSFLKGVEQPQRRVFQLQDLLLQLSMLLTLIPCMLTPRLPLAAMYTVLAGFIALWGIALWSAASRYSYTYRILLGQRGDLAQRLKDIFTQAQQEEKGDSKPG